MTLPQIAHIHPQLPQLEETLNMVLGSKMRPLPWLQIRLIKLCIDDLTFQPGLNIVTGPSASGKTSILLPLLGDNSTLSLSTYHPG
jgi:hypothetical protein